MTKRTIIFLLLIRVTVMGISAADFGLTTDATSSLPYTSGTDIDWTGLTYTVKSALWANGRLSDELTGEVQGGFTITESRVFLLELDQLQLAGSFILPGSPAGALSFKAGRISFSEFSGKVFVHTGDGISFEYGLPGMSMSAFGAYTGLLQGPSSTILMNNSDVAAQAVTPLPLWGPLSSPRIVEGVSFTFPELFAQQTLILTGIFQQDMRPVDEFVTGDSAINTFYAGFGLMGPIQPVASLFYSIYGYGNTGWYGSNTILSYIAGGGINYLMPKFLSSRFALEFTYSSGDADQSVFYEGNTAGYSNSFIPITPAPAGLVFTAQQTNLFYLSCGYSIKPFSMTGSAALQNTVVLLKGIGFFRSTTGAISTGGVKTGETGLYLGTEADLSIMARFLSDLGFSLSGGVFFPSDIMETTSPQIKATVAVSLSM